MRVSSLRPAPDLVDQRTEHFVLAPPAAGSGQSETTVVFVTITAHAGARRPTRWCGGGRGLNRSMLYPLALELELRQPEQQL